MISFKDLLKQFLLINTCTFFYLGVFAHSYDNLIKDSESNSDQFAPEFMNNTLHKCDANAKSWLFSLKQEKTGKKSVSVDVI